MRIEGLPQMMVRSLLDALPRGAPSFQELAGREAQAPAQATPTTAPMPTVEMLVALAAGERGVELRRKLAKDADRGITLLEKLHAALVAGAPSPGQLQEILEWVETAEVPQDPPELAMLMREIDVRVRVELAKLDIQV